MTGDVTRKFPEHNMSISWTMKFISCLMQLTISCQITFLALLTLLCFVHRVDIYVTFLTARSNIVFSSLLLFPFPCMIMWFFIPQLILPQIFHSTLPFFIYNFILIFLVQISVANPYWELQNPTPRFIRRIIYNFPCRLPGSQKFFDNQLIWPHKTTYLSLH